MKDVIIKFINEEFDDWLAKQTVSNLETPTKRELPEGKRAARTKQSGDRVYLLDEVEKTRQWIANPEAMANSGFEMSDVVEVEDGELLNYQMGAPIYKAPENG